MPSLAEIMAAKKAGAGQPAPAVSSAPKITPQSEHAALASKIKDTLDATAPKPLPPLPNSDKRELGATQPGERIPMDHPPADAPQEARDWFNASHSFASDMGIVLDPDNPEVAWLAVQTNRFAPLILVHRLPLLNRPKEGNPF